MKKFDPADIFEELKKTGLDPSAFDAIDERDIPKAPNFLEFVVSPKFLNTRVLPKQLEISLKLLADYCPRCSKPGYINTLYDQSIGNIRDNLMLLEHGKCPKCEFTRYELIKRGELSAYTELITVAGQRCVPKGTYVNTSEGLIKIEDVEEGATVSHGFVHKKIYSGVLPQLELKTRYNYKIRGSRDSHLVAVLNTDLDIEYKLIKDCKVGDVVLLKKVGFWAASRQALPYTSLKEVNPELAYLLGVSFTGSPASELIKKFQLEDSTDDFLRWLVEVKPVGMPDQIPDCILRSPEIVVRAFLKGLFSRSEAGISEGLKWQSTSSIMVRQVRLLLLNLGVISNCWKLKESYLVELIDFESISYNLPGVDFSLRCLKKYPKLKLWVDRGYVPLSIVGIEEGPNVEMYDLQVPDTNCYVADGALVHNSGKTKLTGLLSAYQTHRFLKIPNPLRFFQQPSGELLMGTFSALTMDQAAQTLWESYKGFISASPWFQNYHNFLKEKEKELGLELFHDLKSSTLYAHKQMLWHCTGSEDRKMRGRTRIFASIDELGWFTSDEGKKSLQFMNADAVYTALSNSLATMRMKFNKVWSPENYDVPPILMANISSPSSAKDKSMRLLKSSKTNQRMLGVHAATWDLNPDYTFDSLRDEFANLSMADFMRDFGAEPPLASNPFLEEPKIVDRIAVATQDDTIAFQKFVGEDNFNEKFLSAKLLTTTPNRSHPRLMTFDLGYKKNGLAMCVFSLTPDFKPRLDFALELVPTPKIPINLAHFFDNFTLPFVTLFSVKHAFFDRWQSLDQVQRLRDKDVDASIHSLTYKEIDSVRGAILSQSLQIPKISRPMAEVVKDYIDDNEANFLDNAIDTLGIQLLTVRDVGHKFSKPLLGDDDVFRAFCLGVVKLNEPKIKKVYQSAPQKINSGQSVRALGVVRTYQQQGAESGGGYNGSSVLGVVKTHKKG
jgi:hypothetical protein